MNGEGEHSSPVRRTPVVDDVNQSQPSSSQTEPRNRPSRRGRRGSRLKELSLGRSAGQKIDIQFDDKLNPFGPNKIRYNSYLGFLARSKTSILTRRWRDDCNKTVKDLIWDSIRLTYNVPDSEKLKQKTLSYCADRWRKFKTSLCNNYIFYEVADGRPPPPSPCLKYAFLDEQTWQEFVKMKTTPEALQKRAQAQETGRKNDCPHRYSRGGYELAGKELVAEKRKRLEEEAESNPSVLDNPPTPITREELWLYSRKKRNGAYMSEKTRIVAEKVEELKKKEAEGSFVSDGRNDVLSVAIGKPDHSGRVKGVGGRVGLREYFGSSKRHKKDTVTREEMEQVVLIASQEAAAQAVAQAVARQQELAEAREAEITARFEARMRKMEEDFQLMKASSSLNETALPIPPHVQRSTRGSSTTCAGQAEAPQPADLHVKETPLQLSTSLLPRIKLRRWY